jgi:hypothetical protein
MEQADSRQYLLYNVNILNTYIIYRLAAINPEFYKYFSKWHNTAENNPIKVKLNKNCR